MTIVANPRCPREICFRRDRTLCWACLEPSQRQLAEVARGEDGVLPQSLVAFHDEHRAIFVKYTRSRGISATECEDVVSSTFLLLHRAGRSFLSAQNPSAFAFKVLRDVLTDHVRAADRRPRTLPFARETDAADDGGIGALICRLDIENALDLLPARQADCLRLRLFLDLSHIQIGYYLGITPSAVSSHLSSGRRHLAQHLAGYRPQSSRRAGKERHG